MIKIAFTGDIMLARGVDERLTKSPNELLLSDSIRNLLGKCDYVIGNLESPLTSEAERKSNNGFRASPKSLQQVQEFDLFSLANNHVFDCGEEGALHTISHLTSQDKAFCGILENKMSSYSLEKVIKNKRFAFLSCAVDYCIKDKQEETYPKVIALEDSLLIEEIKKSSSINDYVIVMVHGGNEMIYYPEPDFRRKCESLIKAGASLVVTHHPHIVGGIDVLDNKYIFYSLGDFIFDGKSYLRRKGLILIFSFNSDIIEFELLPTQISDSLSVDFAPKNIRDKIFRKIHRISHVLQKDSLYNKKYRYRYLISLLYFQVDRLCFLFRHEGGIVMIKFVLNKIKLIPHYLKKITS